MKDIMINFKSNHCLFIILMNYLILKPVSLISLISIAIIDTEILL